MKKVLALLTFCLALFSLSAQSVAELESRLKKAGSKSEKLAISYQLAEKLLNSGGKNSLTKASDYATQAASLAIETGDRRKESEANYLSAEAVFRSGNHKEAAARYARAWHSARNFGLREIALNSTEKLQDIALKSNDYKEALKWSRETINYLREAGGDGRSGGDAARRLENRLAAAEADNRSLREQLAQATGQTQLLETSYQSQLKEFEEKTQQTLTQKEADLSKLSQEKSRADSLVKSQSRMVESLTREQLVDSALQAMKDREIESQKRKLVESDLARQKSDALRNVTALIAGFVFVLAFLFYLRFRAKKRAAIELTEKNNLIEAEQKRSDALLLNILPPAIASELKAKNKVAARKYETATVMFIDFTGFTKISEQLSPERLVEELDACFSKFDEIISKYRIEKIKTVGDAYICASGLSDMNASPSDMVKAALEIQDFLQAHKAERQTYGMPYFEARIGIHTGPVVAGVVGAKKFAYDIWGDTVNTAARMEENCEPGHVNVSEDSYWPAKYEFEWQHRGKVPAKNKGMLDMYYVTGVKTY